jgi:hypothetical protein
MRQFNLFQQIPPQAPIDYQQVLMFRKNKHTLGDGEWQIISGHRTIPNYLSRMCDPTTMPNIILIWGGIIREMTTIWYGMNIEKQLSQPLLHPEEPMYELTYVLHSHQNARAVSI